MIKKITILDSGYLLKKSILSIFLGFLKRNSKRGPNIVVDSLLSGLSALGIEWNYNPKNHKNIAEVVIVLGYLETLKIAIKLKRAGKIKKLLAGPNLVVYSTDYNSILGSEYIDKVIVPSEVIKRRYVKDLQIINKKIEIFPTGINIQDWKPKILGKDTVLVYIKTNNSTVIEMTINKLRASSSSYSIIEYGKYTQKQFKDALSRSLYAIFLSESESQGIALLEAWSMNVPTLVWNPGRVIYEGKLITNTSSCPYLTSSTGISWKNKRDFDRVFAEFTSNLSLFNPRLWVASNMTELHSAINLVNMVN